MTTPTNHTASSLFDFGDLVEPEPSQDSLEQHSSIEESTMFISGEASNLGPFKNASAARTSNPSKHPNHETTVPVPPTKTTTAPPGGGILKPSKFAVPPQPKQLQIDTKPKVATVDSMLSLKTDATESKRQPFSPTVHTSNQTGGFAKPNVLSPTVHRSNQRTQDNGMAKPMDPLEMQNDELLDEDLEKAAAWAIHFCLGFFLALIITCVLLTLKVVRQFGFLTFVCMGLVVAFCGFLACFVDSTILSQNPKLKPVRQTIVRVVKNTQQMIQEEYDLFCKDWKEHHLLLTQHGEDGLLEDQLVDDNNNEAILPTTAATKKKRKKSKVFKMIKPFLGFKKKFGGKHRQKTNTDGEPTTPYQAPEI